MPVVPASACSLGYDDGFRPVILLDLAHFVGHRRERFVPGDALPLPGSALSDAFHGVDDAMLGVVVDLAFRHTATAERSSGQGIVGIAFDLDNLVPLRVDDRAAPRMAGGANRPRLFDGHASSSHLSSCDAV